MPLARVEVLKFGGDRAREGAGLIVVDSVEDSSDIIPSVSSQTLLAAASEGVRTVKVNAIGGQIYLAWGASPNAAGGAQRTWVPADSHYVLTLEPNQSLAVATANLS